MDEGLIEFDLRLWAIGHESEIVGISFSQEEATVLYALLQSAFNDSNVAYIPTQSTKQIELELQKEIVNETALFDIFAKHNLEYVYKREKGGGITRKKLGWYLCRNK